MGHQRGFHGSHGSEVSPALPSVPSLPGLPGLPSSPGLPGVRALTGAAALVLAVLATPMNGAAIGDPATEARRVLAAGYELPAGLTIALGRKTVTTITRHPERPDTVRERSRPAIAGTFESNGTTISFEVIRGARMPRWERPEPGDPRYELDVCFRDGEGRPFLAQVGGEDPLDSTCDLELEETPPDDLGELGASFTPEERAASIEAAAAASAALRGLEFKRRFGAEHAALVGAADVLERAETMLAADCTAPNVVCEDHEGGQALTTASHDNRWQHAIAVWSGPIGSHGFYVPGLVGTHGATLGARRDFRNQRVSAAWVRCNHGKCPYEPRMQLQCGFLSSASRTSHVHEEYCTTSYAAYSGAVSPGHNCNDDVTMQYRAVRLNQHAPSGWGSGYPCDDRLTHNYTDRCW